MKIPTAKVRKSALENKGRTEGRGTGRARYSMVRVLRRQASEKKEKEKAKEEESWATRGEESCHTKVHAIVGAKRIRPEKTATSSINRVKEREILGGKDRQSPAKTEV